MARMNYRRAALVGLLAVPPLLAAAQGRGARPAASADVTILKPARVFDGDTLHDVEPIRGSRPDLLIIDLRLRRSGMAGWDVLRAVRADSGLEQLPIILCTGDLQSLEEHAQAITDDVNVATLQKPFHVEELEARVQQFVGEAMPSG